MFELLFNSAKYSFWITLVAGSFMLFYYLYKYLGEILDNGVKKSIKRIVFLPLEISFSSIIGCVALYLPIFFVMLIFNSFIDVFNSNDSNMVRNGYDTYSEPSNFDENENDPGVHWVDSYYRSDGTLVEGHWRSNPDGDPTNNLNYNGQ